MCGILAISLNLLEWVNNFHPLEHAVNGDAVESRITSLNEIRIHPESQKHQTDARVSLCNWRARDVGSTRARGDAISEKIGNRDHDDAESF